MTESTEKSRSSRADQALAILAEQLAYFTPTPRRPSEDRDEQTGAPAYFDAA